MSTIEEDRVRRIYDLAEAHDGKYLLPVRSRKPMPFEPKQEVDLEHDACEALVIDGYARWIPWENVQAPGIFLTGKPFPPLEGQT